MHERIKTPRRFERLLLIQRLLLSLLCSPGTFSVYAGVNGSPWFSVSMEMSTVYCANIVRPLFLKLRFSYATNSSFSYAV